jgi:hypothetical protein
MRAGLWASPLTSVPFTDIGARSRLHFFPSIRRILDIKTVPSRVLYGTVEV